MLRNLWREPYDPNEEFVARRELTLGKKKFKPGQVIPKSLLAPGSDSADGVPVLSPRRHRQLYENRTICFKRVWVKNGEYKKASRRSTIQLTAAPVTPDTTVAPVTLPENPVTPDTTVAPVTLPENPVTPDTTVAPVTLPGLPGLPTAPVATAEPDNRESLINDAKELGIKVDGRWSNKRLQDEIDKVLSGGTA